MTGDQIIAALFGVIPLFGLLFGLADLRAADKDLVRVSAWAEGGPEHELMKHTFRAQLARCVSLAILLVIAALSFTPWLPRVFAVLMFAVAGVLTLDTVAARVSRLKILHMIEENR